MWLSQNLASVCVCVDVPVLHEGIAALTESGCDETNQEVFFWLLALDGAEKIDVGGPVGQPDPHDRLERKPVALQHVNLKLDMCST